MTKLSSNSPTKLDAFLKTMPAKIGVSTIAVGIPIAAIAKDHWERMKTPQAKKRIVIHQVAFWTGTTACITLLHAAYLKRIPYTQIKLLGISRLLVTFVGGLLGAYSYQAGIRLGSTIIPFNEQIERLAAKKALLKQS